MEIGFIFIKSKVDFILLFLLRWTSMPLTKYFNIGWWEGLRQSQTMKLFLFSNCELELNDLRKLFQLTVGNSVTEGYIQFTADPEKFSSIRKMELPSATVCG